MYAQRTKIRVPAATMGVLRAKIENEYLPVVSRRPGFVAAYLLEQVDDDDCAEMIQFWENHAAAEAFTRTGSLASSMQSLAVDLPGAQVQRQGYIVRVAVSASEDAALAYSRS
jgi:hypothetical protein